MASNVLVRMVSLLLAAAIITWLPKWGLWTFSLGFTHYLLSFAYAGAQLRELTRRPASWAAVLMVGGIGVGLYLSGFSLVLYFGLHHALNEAYAPRRLPEHGAPLSLYRAAAVFWHAAVYVFVLRRDASFLFLGASTLALALIVSGLLVLVCASRLRDKLAGHQWIELLGPEILLGVVGSLSIWLKLAFLQVVLYHFVFWALLPLRRLPRTGARGWPLYVAASVLLTAFFFFLGPSSSSGSRAGSALYLQQFMLWSFVHITASLALSNAHPRWLIGVFRPAALDHGRA